MLLPVAGQGASNACAYAEWAQELASSAAAPPARRRRQRRQQGRRDACDARAIEASAALLACRLGSMCELLPPIGPCKVQRSSVCTPPPAIDSLRRRSARQAARRRQQAHVSLLHCDPASISTLPRPCLPAHAAAARSVKFDSLPGARSSICGFTTRLWKRSTPPINEAGGRRGSGCRGAGQAAGPGRGALPAACCRAGGRCGQGARGVDRFVASVCSCRRRRSLARPLPLPPNLPPGRMRPRRPSSRRTTSWTSWASPRAGASARPWAHPSSASCP